MIFEQIIQFIITILAAGLGGGLVGFFSKRGEHKAIKKDFSSILDQLKKTTQATAEIQTTLNNKNWISQKQWEKKEQFYTELLTALCQLEVSLADMDVDYDPPRTVYDRKIEKSNKHQTLAKESQSAIKKIRLLAGAASIYLTKSTNEKLEELICSLWSAQEFSSHHAEYLKGAHTATTQAYEKIQTEAKQDLGFLLD